MVSLEGWFFPSILWGFAIKCFLLAPRQLGVPGDDLEGRFALLEGNKMDDDFLFTDLLLSYCRGSWARRAMTWRGGSRCWRATMWMTSWRSSRRASSAAAAPRPRCRRGGPSGAGGGLLSVNTCNWGVGLPSLSPRESKCLERLLQRQNWLCLDFNLWHIKTWCLAFGLAPPLPLGLSKWGQRVVLLRSIVNLCSPQFYF